jgi:hypothetical protein
MYVFMSMPSWSSIMMRSTPASRYCHVMSGSSLLGMGGMMDGIVGGDVVPEARAVGFESLERGRRLEKAQV